MVASSLRSDPELNLQFRNRVAELLPLFEGSRLASRVQTLQQKLRSEFANLNPEGLEDIDRKIAELVDRLRERHRNIIQHLAQPDPPIPDPSTDDVYAVGELGVGEIAMISDWHPIQETEQAQLERLEPEDNHDAMIPPGVVYTIAVGDADECVASWRKTVLLPAGRYAFVAELRVEDVVERVQDDRGRGAGLRISGANRENNLLASSEWSSLKFEFQITEEQQAVQLVSELRAIKGKMAMRNPGIIRTSP